MVIKSIPAKEMPELVENDNFVNPTTCGHGDSSGSDGHVVNDHVGDHKHDPHYKMFLENVKQDGQCYALSVFQENRAPEVLRYEIGYSVVDKRGAETAEAYESYPVRQSIIGKRILRRLFNGENTEIVSCSADFSSWGDACSPRMLRYLARNNRKRESMETSYDELSVRRRISSARRNEGGESSIRSGLADNYLIKYEIGNDGHVDDVPSERGKICLAGKRAGKELKGHNSGGTSLRSGSKSKQLAENVFDHDDGDDGVDDDDAYMRFLCSDDGGLGSEGEFLDQCVSDHEDEIDDSDEYHRLCSEGDFLDKCVSVHEDDLDERCTRILNSGSRGTIGGSYGGTKLGSEEKFSDQHQSDREYEIRDKDENELHHEDEIDDSDEYYGLINCVRRRMNGQSNTRPRLVNSHLVKCRCDREDLSDEIDKEYVAFVNQLEKDRENAIYNVEDSTWRFDEVEESESDIEIMDKDPNSGGARSPFVSSKREQIGMEVIDLDNYSFTEDSSIRCSQFKKGLIEVLKMPYDSKEHEALKHEVSRRRPLIQETVEGDTKKSYRVEHKLGKSHLDLYSDLAKQLKQAKDDDLKSFNLLRGYFYWLKHISEDKGFKPWLDPSCLEVLPQKLNRRTEHVLKSEYKQTPSKPDE